MMRPSVLVATTDPAMASALGARLNVPCRELGLRLEVCPGGQDSIVEDTAGDASPARRLVPVYESAEALFDHLESRHPADLAETLIVLDVGADLEESLAPVATTRATRWHVTMARRLGVAAELILRFPQVFPVIYSPAVPTTNDLTTTEKSRSPEVLQVIDGGKEARDNGPKAFARLSEQLKPKCKEPLTLALFTPLHFVTPLDCGAGLVSVLARFARGMRCWFDPTGIRTLVRNRFLGNVFGTQEKWGSTAEQRSVLLSRLENTLVAVDEERAFVVFNGYAAYKLGCRAWMITSYNELNGTPLWNQSVSANILIVRDLDLRFPDIPDQVGIRKDLRTVNGETWKQLLNPRQDTTLECATAAPPWRIRVVSGDDAIDDPSYDDPKNPDHLNSDYLNGEHEIEGSMRFVGLRKPIGSLYQLSRLFKEPPSSISSLIPAVTDENNPGGHGARYSNLAVAESLLSSAGRCQSGPVEHLVGALLAMEAYELLLGMSPTTALTALTEQHKHEVAAEVKSPGVAHAIRIDLRKQDIEATVTKLAGKAGIGKYHVFLSQFWDQLRAVYREGEEFQAAEDAGAESLAYGSWSRSSHRRGSNYARGIHRFKQGVVKVATSLPWLACAHVGWILVASLSYGIVGLVCGFYAFEPTESGVRGALALVLSVGISSLSMQPDGEVRVLLDAAPIAGGLVAVVHLLGASVLFGLLISTLFRRVTRS